MPPHDRASAGERWRCGLMFLIQPMFAKFMLPLFG